MAKRNKIFGKNIKNPNANNIKQNKPQNGSNFKIKSKPDMLKKEKINLNSKFKKKLKTTHKLLQIDDDKLNSSIQAILTENLEKNKLIKKKKSKLDNKTKFENVYLYILLKNEKIDEDENENKNEKLKQLKSKLIKLPVKTINEKNQHRICLVDDNLLNLKQKQQNQNNYNKIEDDSEVDKNQEKIMNKLALDEEDEQFLEIMTSNDFISQLKSKECVLQNLYHNFIISDKLVTRINQIIQSKDEKTIGLNFIYYNKTKYGKKIFEYLKNLINLTKNSAILNVNLKSNLGIIKIGNSAMNNSELFKNAKLILYKVVSILLSVSEKHTAVKCVVLKTENSLPYEIVNTLSSADLELF